MTDPQLHAQEETTLGDFLRPLSAYRPRIWRGTAAIVVLIALLGALYYLLQPVTRIGLLGFRPLFEGAERGKYPNGLPFSPNDIDDASIVDQVIRRNQLNEFCSAETIRAGVSVREASPELQFLDFDYQARLSEPRLTPVERQRIQDEYTSRRSSLPLQYQLSFVHPRGCKPIPDELASKMLNEILKTWAVESQEKRGVLQIQVGVITPAIFDQAHSADEPILVRADLIRSAMVRVLTNIADVEKLPGAELIHATEARVSLAEVRAHIEDLMLARLDPLIGIAGKGLGARSAQWTEQALQTATAQQTAADRVAETYRQALREYSGLQPSPASGGSTSNRAPGSSDVQALTPQIDRTFIESIVAMSAANTTFRQEITRKMIDASNEAVKRGAVVEHYRALLASMRNTSGETMPFEQVNQKLAKITAESKEQTRFFNDICDEFSRVSFRPSSSMYRVERPADVAAVKGFSVRNYVTLLVGVLLVTPIILAIFYLALHHSRKFFNVSR